MLHYLEAMIGFVFTIVVISLAVTAMVQAVPIYMRSLKGEALERGLIDLMVRVLSALEMPRQGECGSYPARSVAVTAALWRDQLDHADTIGRQAAAAVAQRGGAARVIHVAAASLHGAG